MTLTNSLNGFDGAQELLIKLVEQSPEEWETRKRVVQVLYDAGCYRDASKLIWNAPEIPPVTEEMVFTARIVAKGQPERAVRLLSTVVERNVGCPEENMAIAKELMKNGLVLQALRFYGAATADDISLIDEDFELALVKTDCSEDTWRDVVEGEDFPWQGPQELSISDMMDEHGDGEVSAAEILLSSVTQRVPLKAPVKSQPAPQPEAAKTEEMRAVESAGVAGQAALSEAKAAVNSSTSMLSPAAEALVKQMSNTGQVGAASAPVKQSSESNGDDSFSSLVNFFKHKEEQQTANPEVPRSKIPEPIVAPQVQVQTNVHSDIPPAPSTPLLQNYKPAPTRALKQIVPEVVVAEKVAPHEAPAPEPTPSAQDEQADSVAAFFKSSDEASVKSNEAPQVNSVANTEVSQQAPATSLASEPAAPVNGQSSPAVQPAPQAAADDLRDSVASALAEREANVAEPKEGGVLSSCKSLFGFFKSKKNKSQNAAVESAEPEADSLVMPQAEPAASQAPAFQAQPPAQTEAPPQQNAAVSSPASTPTAAPQPPASQPAAVQEPAPQSQAPIATTVLRKPEQDQYEPPRELDGRTQLVALAPQDGSAFFDQLLAKYNALPAGTDSQAAMVARDMANVDYLQLIRSACQKDLDAFSKLLGLHRVMTEGDCSDWVADMDLLRKGYGDAVLATVVSKYSVTECREILGAVYQRPRAQQAV
ncbi:hypothetical protein NT6N_04960 [Oceaniferula spumae]|uniref:Tetratricopeptide repeat protein n=1 Tax=Oceaniferula spumae TaxID=2979115 RepID=A0AAT9FHL0_9BACT